MGLTQLRQTRNRTQEQLASLLDVPQSTVSKMEHRTDMYVSSLRSYIEAMGGRLELKAVFPDAQVEVEINRFENIEAPSPNRRPKKDEGVIDAQYVDVDDVEDKDQRWIWRGESKKAQVLLFARVSDIAEQFAKHISSPASAQKDFVIKKSDPLWAELEELQRKASAKESERTSSRASLA